MREKKERKLPRSFVTLGALGRRKKKEFCTLEGSICLERLESVRIGKCQNAFFFKIGKCQNAFFSKLESVRIGKCQNRKVSELESVRIGKCQNWKVSEFSDSLNIGQMLLG